MRPTVREKGKPENKNKSKFNKKKRKKEERERELRDHFRSPVFLSASAGAVHLPCGAGPASFPSRRDVWKEEAVRRRKRPGSLALGSASLHKKDSNLEEREREKKNETRFERSSGVMFC